MLNTRDTPPPLLHSSSLSDQASSTSRETTPFTPVALGSFPAKRFDKTFDALPWFQRPPQTAKSTRSLCLDSTLVDPDFDENTFPQFGASPRDRSMALAAAPNETFSNRQTSTSPRGNQPSGLTAAFKKSDSGERIPTSTSTMEAPPSLVVSDSSDMSRFENGARPISMKGRPTNQNRRESIAQSLGMGMSWGGASVGSWIRDE